MSGLLDGRPSLETHWLVSCYWMDLENSFYFSALSSHSGTWMLLRNRSFSSPTLTLSSSVPGWIMLRNERFGGKSMYSFLSVFLDWLWESGLLKNRNSHVFSAWFLNKQVVTFPMFQSFHCMPGVIIFEASWTICCSFCENWQRWDPF